MVTSVGRPVPAVSHSLLAAGRDDYQLAHTSRVTNLTVERGTNRGAGPEGDPGRANSTPRACTAGGSACWAEPHCSPILILARSSGAPKGFRHRTPRHKFFGRANQAF